MIIEKEILSKLKDFGLNSYESKLWTALLSRGSSTSSELSDIANVPRSRSYDVLESLERKGFVILKLGKPIKYVAVPPSQVLNLIKNNADKEAQEKINQLEKLKNSDIIKELNSLHQEGKNTIDKIDLSGSIKGQPNIHNHLEQMIKKAKNSILMVAPSASLKGNKSFILEKLEESKKTGIKTKLILNGKKEDDIIKKVDYYKKDMDGMFCVVDNSEVLFMLTDEKTHPTYEAAVWLNSDFFANSLSSIVDEFTK